MSHEPFELPPSLPVWLEAGNHPRALLGDFYWAGLVDWLADLSVMTSAERERIAEQRLIEAQYLAAGGPPLVPPGKIVDQAYVELVAVDALWHHDLLVVPGLLDRLEAVLTDDEAAELARMRAEYHKPSARLASVTAEEEFLCHVCCRELAAADRALRVESDYAVLVLCASCVADQNLDANPADRQADEALVTRFGDYMRFRSLSNATVARRLSTARRFCDHIAPRSLLDATGEDVVSFVGTCSAKGETRAAYFSDLKNFYRWAVNNDLMLWSPCERLESPLRPKRLPTPLTSEELRRLLEEADKAAPGTRLPVLLGVFAGLRVSEISALHSRDVRLSEGTLTVRGGKGAKDRTLPLHPVLAAALADLEPGPVVQPSGSSKAMYFRIKKIFSRCGIDARAHDLRHTFATEAARAANGNLVMVAQLLGHTNTSTTQKYVGWTPESAAVVGSLFGDLA